MPKGVYERKKRKLPPSVKLKPKKPRIVTVSPPPVDWILDDDDLQCKEKFEDVKTEKQTPTIVVQSRGWIERDAFCESPCESPSRGWFPRELMLELSCKQKAPILHHYPILPVAQQPPELPSRPPEPSRPSELSRPTELEELCIARQVPAFEYLPRPWTANVSIDLFGDGHCKPFTLYLAAFCSKRRLCLCVSPSNVVYCLDADELFCANYIIHRTFVPFSKMLLRPCEPCNRVGDLIYPYQLSVQPLASVFIAKNNES